MRARSVQIDRRMLAQFDWVVFVLSLLIPFTGLAVLYSAGYDPEFDGSFFNWLPVIIRSKVFMKQLAFLGAGLIVMLVAIAFPTRMLYRMAYFVYCVCIALLVGVLLFGVISHGSRRWFSLGAYNFQPSELMKIGLILGLARYLANNPPKRGLYGFSELLIPFAMFGLPMALIMKQPDLGTALSIGAIGFSMVLFMGIRPRALIFMVVAAAATGIPAYYSLHPYQRRRIEVLINPEADPQGSGWHIQQSKIAVGSGQIFGKGFLEGTQTQLEFLPERTTDFIFCVLAEEGGFFASVFVLTLYAFFIFRLMRVALRSKHLFSVLLSFGIATMIFFHVIINIGMVIGLLPIVGLPLPLFSYGGSALMSNLFAIGLVLGVSMRRLLFVK